MDIAEDDRIRLLDIADSIREISACLGNTSYKEFLQEEELMMEVTSQLVQIGGAASELSDDFKEKHGDVDWDVLRGLQYANYDKELELDLHCMWQIINSDLSEIMQKVSDLSTYLEKQELADDEGIKIEDLEEPEDFFGTRKRRLEESDEELLLGNSKRNKSMVIRLPSYQIDKIDIEDDTDIEEKFDELQLLNQTASKNDKEV